MADRPSPDVTEALRLQPSSDRTAHHPRRLILDAVGEEILAEIVGDSLDVLGISAAVCERNGDYAFLGVCPSGWCQKLGAASTLDNTDADREARQGTGWPCHESCWHISQAAMALNRALDLPCQGGIRVYAVPIRAGGEVVGSIHFGYGNPPTDLHQLRELARHSGRSVDELRREAAASQTHTVSTLDLAKRRLATAARVIGEIVQRQRAEAALAAEMHFLRLQTALAQVALSGLTLESLGPRLLDTICRAQGYTAGALWQVSADLQEVVLLAGYGEGVAPFLGFRQALQAPDSLMAHTVRTRQPYVCNRIQESSFRTRPITRILGTQALLGLPLVDRAGHVLGIMTFGDAHDPERFSERDLAQGTVLAHQVAMALDNSRLFSQVAQLQERDCSERLHLEMQLHQAQRLEALGTLAGGIAHDFNNILGAVLGYTELTLDDMPQGSRAWDNLQHVLTAGQRAKMLVQQILAFSRHTEQERQPLQLHPLIQEVCKLLQATLPATITLSQHLNKSADTVVADATQLHQVLMNLCTNAAYAMRDTGGVLEVHLDAQELTADLAAQHPALQPGPYVRLCVRDTGHGIAPEIQEHIFEPFFTTKGIGEGTGMGLAVAHGIVSSHGGVIAVESAPGQGATFTVYLPQSDAPAREDNPWPAFW